MTSLSHQKIHKLCDEIEALLADAMPKADAMRYQRIAFVANCRIPDDCIDSKRYPLFMARAVLKELIESLQSTQGVKPC